VRSLIYILAYVFVLVTVCTCVRIGCAPQLCCFSLPPISGHFSSQTLLNKDRQCCESWRDAELGVRAVCAVGDTTDEDR